MRQTIEQTQLKLRERTAIPTGRLSSTAPSSSCGWCRDSTTWRSRRTGRWCRGSNCRSSCSRGFLRSESGGGF